MKKRPNRRLPRAQLESFITVTIAEAPEVVKKNPTLDGKVFEFSLVGVTVRPAFERRKRKVIPPSRA